MGNIPLIGSLPSERAQHVSGGGLFFADNANLIL
jgi:hypothetical protein